MDSIIVIGSDEQREQLFAQWAKGRDPWYLRRDVQRIDARRIEEVDIEQISAATEILTSDEPPPQQTLDDDPWTAHEQAMQLWPDAQTRLRQLKLHHLHRGWPAHLLPTRADTAARVLGYFLRVNA
jgi:hypothetical protein